jgi:hypothetical protein
MRMSKMILIAITVLFFIITVFTIIVQKDSAGLVLGLFALYGAGIFCAKYLGHVSPQYLEEGVEYIFMGYDVSGKIAFLKHHIHIEGVVYLPGIANNESTTAQIMRDEKGNIITAVYEDYDDVGIYKIDFKDPTIRIGDKVQKSILGKEKGLIKIAA